jgi:hypothetical protein
MSLMWELVDGAFIDVAEVAAAGFINPDAIEWKSLSDHLWCGGAIGAEIGCGDAVHGGAGKGLVVQRVAVGGEGDRIGSELTLMEMPSSFTTDLSPSSARWALPVSVSTTISPPTPLSVR